MAIQNLTIYGSGDSGTLELRAICTKHNIPYTFVDIRVRPSKRSKRCALTFLANRRLFTVPQVFAPDGELIGGFEQAVNFINKMTHVSDDPPDVA